jgi:hypothetical protein
MNKLRLALAVGCLMVMGSATGAYAQESAAAGRGQGREIRSLVLVLHFSTCSAPVKGAYTCDLTDGSGKTAGTITVSNFQEINSSPVAMSWHEDWRYDLRGGTITVEDATAWQVVGAAVPDENGIAPAALGFGSGEIDEGTGRFKNVTGTITMRWDGETCICLIEFA